MLNWFELNIDTFALFRVALQQNLNLSRIIDAVIFLIITALKKSVILYSPIEIKVTRLDVDWLTIHYPAYYIFTCQINKCMDMKC